jgi:hypothetical protein
MRRCNLPVKYVTCENVAKKGAPLKNAPKAGGKLVRLVILGLSE